MAGKKEFKHALETIGDAFVDFSKLEVRTFVGSIKVEVQGDEDPKWDELMKTAITDGTVLLAASTTVRIDGDSDHFEDVDRMTDGLRASHQNAILAGQASRKAIFDMITDKVKSLIKQT